MPRLDLIGAVGQPQNRVLERLGAGRLGATVVGDPFIHPGCVRLEVGLSRRREHGPLLLGHPAPAQGAQERVGGDLVGAEQLGHAARGHVAAEVHLPEAVLGMHVPLGPEQVGRGLRVQVRDAVPVPVHGHGGGEAGQVLLAAEVGESPPYRPDDKSSGDQGDGDQHPGGPQPDPTKDPQ